MKRTKRLTLSTDYFFEALFKKIRAFFTAHMPSKLAFAKLIAIAHWFKADLTWVCLTAHRSVEFKKLIKKLASANTTN